MIVGAGLAGAKAAETLRSEGFDGRVVLIGDEPVTALRAPAECPRTTCGARPTSTVPPSTRLTFTTPTTSNCGRRPPSRPIDPTTSGVELAPGGRLTYDRLLLCNGAEPRGLTVPGSTLPGVLYLRTGRPLDALRQAIIGRGPVVVIGAGWIG